LVHPIISCLMHFRTFFQCDVNSYQTK
jgi:hypothetical protein